MKKGFIEIKRNGAGRLYFVLSTSEGADILISQSFENIQACEECIEALKKAFSTGKSKEGLRMPAYEAARGFGGIFILKILKDDGTAFLLSGYGNGEEEGSKIFGILHYVLEDCNICKNGLK